VVPQQKSKLAWLLHTKLYFGFGLAFVVYLLFGYSNYNRAGSTSHYSLLSPIFRQHRIQVFTSILGCCLMLLGTFIYGNYDGWYRLVIHYYCPLLSMYSWLVVTTFLHHGADVPWYKNEHWTFLLGSLSTCDRTIGIFDSITHHITTHQIHHLFPRIPHYNLKEATTLFRSNFPQLVKLSTSSFWEDFVSGFDRYATHFKSNDQSQPMVYSFPKPNAKQA